MAAWLRVHLAYLCRHRRLLSLKAPKHFTEFVQRRKLYDHDLRLPSLIDKIEVKHFVIERLGEEWVTPTLWSGTKLPEAPIWAPPYVVKSRHGCNQRRFVRTGMERWDPIRRSSARWMRSNYGYWLDEWGYRGIKRGLLVEAFVGDGIALPIDYKFYVFRGHVAFIQVHLDREHRHRWLVFDRDWVRVSASTGDKDPNAPLSLERMIEGAEILSKGFDFVRIDFYELDGEPRFGEMTFYPGSGLDQFDPPKLDLIMGSWWEGSLQASD